jgi:hypothetical protein
VNEKLPKFVQRLEDRLGYTEIEFMTALILFFRFYNSRVNHSIFRDGMKFFITAGVSLLLAFKLSSDVNVHNSEYKKLLYLPALETFNEKEVYFLQHINYSLWITGDEYHKWKELLQPPGLNMLVRKEGRKKERNKWNKWNIFHE